MPGSPWCGRAGVPAQIYVSATSMVSASGDNSSGPSHQSCHRAPRGATKDRRELVLGDSCHRGPERRAELGCYAGRLPRHSQTVTLATCPSRGPHSPCQSRGWSSPAPRRLHTGRAVGHATRVDVFRSKFTGHMINARWEDSARSESCNCHGGASRRQQSCQDSTGGGRCLQSTFHVPWALLSGGHTTPPQPSSARSTGEAKS